MRLFTLFVTVLGTLWLTGCTVISTNFVYPADMNKLVQFGSTPALNKTVAVLPFDDWRGNENLNRAALMLIPLMPFGWADYERPDAVGFYSIKPSEDLAKAAAVSLRHSSLFKDAVFTMGGEKERADFVLRGRIKELSYHGRSFSYGFSIYGVYLWFLGAPMTSAHTQLALEIQMLKGDCIVWEWSGTRRAEVLAFLYGTVGSEWKDVSMLYQAMMNEAITNLSRKIMRGAHDFK